MTDTSDKDVLIVDLKERISSLEHEVRLLREGKCNIHHKIRISWMGHDGETEYEAFAWIPKEGPDPTAPLTSQIEMLAHEHEVSIEVVEDD